MKTKGQASFKLQLLELRKRLLREVGKAEEALREDVVNRPPSRTRLKKRSSVTPRSMPRTFRCRPMAEG